MHDHSFDTRKKIWNENVQRKFYQESSNLPFAVPGNAKLKLPIEGFEDFWINSGLKNGRRKKWREKTGEGKIKLYCTWVCGNYVNVRIIWLIFIQRASEIQSGPCTGDSTDSSDNETDSALESDSPTVSRAKSVSVSDRLLRRGSAKKKVLKTCAQYTTHNLKSVRWF
jgi:hypothetical protein